VHPLGFLHRGLHSAFWILAIDPFSIPPVVFLFLPLSTPDSNRFSFCRWSKAAFIPLFDFLHKLLFWSCSVASGSYGGPFDFHLSIQERIASFPVEFLTAGRRCTGVSCPHFVTPARHSCFSLLAHTISASIHVHFLS
jgi:hypothetical protein